VRLLEDFKMKLLDRSGANTKLAKTNDGSEYLVAGLSLMPDDIVCAYRKRADCGETCLVFTGMARVFPKINQSRQRKTDWYHSDQGAFLEQLRKELRLHQKNCEKKGIKPAVRLNVLSDIAWEKHGIPQEFPDIFFYDYTKNAFRLGRTPDNYHLIFSYSGAEEYQKFVTKAWETDSPVAVVFKNRVPASFMGRVVVDGDKSDLDNVVAGRVIIGLVEKLSGSESPVFMVDPDLIAVAA
jgi:hypothetical protein